MIDVNELRKGVTFELDSSLYKVLDYDHHKPGRGKATIRVKIRDLRNGNTLEMSFNSGDRVQDVQLDYHTVQYLYQDGDLFHFMDLDTYDQPAIRAELLGDDSRYLKDGLEVKLTFFEGEALDLELPTTVDLQVVEAEMALKGDRASPVTKRVVTETGLEVQVPAFVEVDDIIRIDTRSGAYVTRV